MKRTTGGRAAKQQRQAAATDGQTEGVGVLPTCPKTDSSDATFHPLGSVGDLKTATRQIEIFLGSRRCYDFWLKLVALNREFLNKTTQEIQTLENAAFRTDIPQTQTLESLDARGVREAIAELRQLIGKGSHFALALKSADIRAMLREGCEYGMDELWLDFSLCPPRVPVVAALIGRWVDAEMPERSSGFKSVVIDKLALAARQGTEPDSLLVALTRLGRWYTDALNYLGGLEKHLPRPITEKDLNDTDREIAKAIRQKPGIKGQQIADAVHNSFYSVRKRLQERMPLNELGFRQKDGKQGYWPP